MTEQNVWFNGQLRYVAIGVAALVGFGGAVGFSASRFILAADPTPRLVELERRVVAAEARTERFDQYASKMDANFARVDQKLDDMQRQLDGIDKRLERSR